MNWSSKKISTRKQKIQLNSYNNQCQTTHESILLQEKTRKSADSFKVKRNQDLQSQANQKTRKAEVTNTETKEYIQLN